MVSGRRKQTPYLTASLHVRRFAFWINLPLAGAAIAVSYWLLPLKGVTGNLREKFFKIDYLGSGLTIISSVLILVSSHHALVPHNLVFTLHFAFISWVLIGESFAPRFGSSLMLETGAVCPIPGLRFRCSCHYWAASAFLLDSWCGKPKELGYLSYQVRP